MAVPSSQMVTSESEMVPELPRVMPVDLYRAVVKGDGDVLRRCLGLEPEVQTECQLDMEGPHSAPIEINTENQTVQSKLHSVTHFGDTILHLLITAEHNELALKVIQHDESLLKARNNMLETPLYCAVKVGNTDIIDKLHNHAVVKNVIAETNKNGYSALHVAIIKGYTEMVQRILDVDSNLACTPFPEGMFPIHEAAHKGNLDLVMLFMQKCSVDAELRDPYGRNLFHIAVEKKLQEFFNIPAIEEKYFKEKDSLKKMMKRMITAQDHDGNTPLHIAAMKGNREIMKAIWKQYKDAKTGPTPFELKNKQGYTPLQLSAKQVLDTNKDIDKRMIDKYLKAHRDYKFTRKWFRVVMAPPLENAWERTQVIGLGSVLITTVAFAAAFTIPGGYDQNNGTPVLGRRHMFQAFILANTLAFLQAFVSLFTLILNGLRDQFNKDSIPFATYSFLCAASSMVVAFGLGLYVTLAPVSYPIAVFLLVFTLIIGSPAVMIVFFMGKSYLQSAANSSGARGFCFVLPPYALSLLIIFCLPFM